MSKYLLLKLGAFGDLGFFLPALEQIRAHDGAAEITWIVGNSYTELIKNIPSVHRVIGVEESALFTGSLWKRGLALLKLASQLDTHYDQVWIGHRTTGALMLLRFRVLGRYFQLVRGPSRFLKCLRTEVIVLPLTLHESHAFRLLAETALGKQIPAADWRADYSWVPSLGAGLNTGLGAALNPVSDLKFVLQQPYIVIHLGGGQNGKTDFLLKQWPHWLEFINKLVNKTKHPIILVGAASERALADQILKSQAASQAAGQAAGQAVDLGDPSSQSNSLVGDLTTNEPGPEARGFPRFYDPLPKNPIVSLVGKTTFLELLVILKAAHRFIGVDSGPLHFADSLGVPTLGLYGPTSEVSWGLLGTNSQTFREPIPCSPCYRDTGEFPTCPYELNRCMTGLTPERVLQQIPGV